MKYIILLVIVILSFAAPSFAEKSYTPDQLQSMVKSESFPKHGPAKVVKKMESNTEECSDIIAKVIGAISPISPFTITVNGNIEYSVKIFAGDGVVYYVCDPTDKTMTVKLAKYR